METEICFMTATELVHLIQTKQLSAYDVMVAHLAQIERINPKVNAIVSAIPPEKALQAAQAADEALAKGQSVGVLHGLPIAHKDLQPTKGLTTTFGSPIFKDFVPEQNSLTVERLQKAGAITIGKTNVPEFGAGSQTFNPVFGATHNPYDLTKTCGGSSGGAAVALATGMLPIADGSDTGGSLRNPANFCNVVGFRTAPGRVPVYPNNLGWFTYPVTGPMARTVQDCALLLSAMAGPDPRVPISIAEAGSKFNTNLQRDFKKVRIAWTQDFGGLLPVDPQVTAALETARPIFEALGCEIDDTQPDFSGADEVFRGWRAWAFEAGRGPLVEQYGHLIKKEILWEIEQGKQLTGQELARLEIKRTEIYQRVTNFMQNYEFLICPVNQVPPFDINQPYPDEINGVKLERYTDWMLSCAFITVTGLPAISVPCGFTPEGLPVGLQIVGRHQAELDVLKLAYSFEQATQLWKRRPAIVDIGEPV